jgi:hypothetical protein
MTPAAAGAVLTASQKEDQEMSERERMRREMDRMLRPAGERPDACM